jgi:hypothetical protein
MAVTREVEICCEGTVCPITDFPTRKCCEKKIVNGKKTQVCCNK